MIEEKRVNDYISDKNQYEIFRHGIQKTVWEKQPFVLQVIRWLWIIFWIVNINNFLETNEKITTNIFMTIFVISFYTIGIIDLIKNRKWFKAYYYSKVKI